MTVPGYEHALFMRVMQHRLLAGQPAPALTATSEELLAELDGGPAAPSATAAATAAATPVAPAPAEPAEGRAATPAVTPDDPKESVGSFEAPPLPLVAYTDGSGTQAHRPCGAGVVVYDEGEAILEASRPLGAGTNNHAELSGVRIALFITDAPGLRERPLVVRTDSQYVIGAVTAPFAPDPWRPNARLIVLVRRALAGRVVRFEHVKGHSGVAGNERADALAGRARLSQIEPPALAAPEGPTP